MALNTKDWVFVFEVLESTCLAVYVRGYSDGKNKKPAATVQDMRLSPAAKMRLQSSYNQTFNQRR